MRPNRVYSHKSQTSQLNKSHIVQAHLDRKSQLINKYQTETNDLMEQIQSKQPYRRAPILNVDKSARKRGGGSSLRKDTVQLEANFVGGGSLRQYNKLILGLQYALEAQRNKNEQLTQKNQSLQAQVSNLRNLLMGPDQQKHYQKTAHKESQTRIQYLQSRIIEQKKNYQFIIDSKNQILINLQLQLKTLKKSFDDKTTNNDQALSRRVLDLVAEMQQLKHLITKKNIIIERLKYQGQKDQDSDDEEVVKIRKMERLKFYLEQFQISNKLIMKKNVEILGFSNKVMSYEKVLDVIELYLDKKQVKGVDLSILEHPCVNKLRILLREKAVFEKQLLNQLNDHNKKIATFQSQITGRQRTSTQKMSQIINDNKRLASTVTNLQSTIANLQRELQNTRKQNQLLTNQIQIKKRQFIQQVIKLKDQVGTISSVTKNQFDRMKIENLKLSEQNRSLLFLVGEKEREIHKKGEAIKTFQQYREKINTLNVGEKDKRKIEAVSQDGMQQVGTKVLMLNDFPNWLMEWKKIKNWVNKKTLLNLILDKEEIRGSALNQMNQLANSVINQCLLQSKNVQIQERGTILTSYFLNHNILQNPRLSLNNLVPIFIRGFRPIIEGEDQSKCRLLNESALKIISQLSKTKKKESEDPPEKQSRIIAQSPRKQTYKQAALREYKWTYQMTNQMLAVNGLKYIFNTIRTAQIDQLVEAAFNVLIFIVKNNQMISFMMSYDLSSLVLNNLNGQYHFILYLLTLVKHLIQSNDFLKLQNNILQFRKLFDVLPTDDDQQLLQLCLQCLLSLMQKSTIFTRSLDKIKSISILSTILRKSNQQCNQQLLKYCGQVYINIVTEMESENINKYVKTEIDKLLEVVKLRKFHEFRFTRIMRVLGDVVGIVQDSGELDEKILVAVVKLYESYQMLDTDMRIKLNQILNTLFQRNKELLNRYSNQSLISNFTQSYKSADNLQQKLFLLKIIIFQAEQKRTTQLLRTGRQSMLSKFISDSLTADYNIGISALKAMLLMVKQKYCEKFVNQNVVSDIVNKVLHERGEEEYIGVALSILYFLCKAESTSVMALEAGIVAKVCMIIKQRQDKQQIIFKALAVLQICHSQNYKKRILNYFIASDNNLQILKQLNFCLRKAKNKIQMGTRAVFLYDYFNNTTSVQSLAILAQRNNQWLIQDLIMLRNQYIGKVDGIVYKIQMLLHQMSQKSNKVKKLYQKYKVAGGDSGQEDD